MKPAVDKRTFVSVVIPVKNGAGTLDQCLRAVKRSYYTNVEVIVVDDHSTDDSVEIARRYDCKVLELNEGRGANTARNFGARQAAGSILIFLDSDIVIERETVLSVVETLEDIGCDAVVGIYTARHRHENLISQYKNLWIRYSYIKSPPAIDWLFGAVSGIKRGAFERLEGFNVDLLARHGHDDLDLGKRFTRENLSIVLNMDIEVEHLKRYSFISFIKNEYHRSAGFARLALRLGEAAGAPWRGFVNVYPSFVLSTILSIPLFALAVACGAGAVPLWMGGTVAGAYVLMNIRFLNYLEQVRGLFAMIVMAPVLFLDHVVCCVGSVAGLAQGLLRKETRDQ